MYNPNSREVETFCKNEIKSRICDLFILFNFYLHLSDAFIQSDLQCIQTIHVFVSMCVSWESNPQPFALLTQCSTTEPQEHNIFDWQKHKEKILHKVFCKYEQILILMAATHSKTVGTKAK